MLLPPRVQTIKPDRLMYPMSIDKVESRANLIVCQCLDLWKAAPIRRSIDLEEQFESEAALTVNAP
jgi:hypothetical protein